MDNLDYQRMTIEHDKHIDALTTSISHLVDSVGSTNRKLEDVVDVISQQNVIVERMNNLDANLKESFNRVHKSIRFLETSQLDFIQRKVINVWGGILLTYTIAFGSYMVVKVHSSEDEIHSHIEVSKEIIPHIMNRVVNLEKVSHTSHRK